METTPFATVRDFATYARRDLSAKDTATVEDHLTSASQRIRNRCGWHLWPIHADETVLVEGSGSRLLTLPTLALDVVEAITVVEDPHGAAAAVDATGFRPSSSGMLRRVDGGIWGGEFLLYAVTMTHGLPDNPDPPEDGSAAPVELRDLVCGMVGRAFVSPTGAIREQSGTVSITYSQTGPSQSGGIVLTRADRDALEHFRIGTD